MKGFGGLSWCCSCLTCSPSPARGCLQKVSVAPSMRAGHTWSVITFFQTWRETSSAKCHFCVLASHWSLLAHSTETLSRPLQRLKDEAPAPEDGQGCVTCLHTAASLWLIGVPYFVFRKAPCPPSTEAFPKLCPRGQQPHGRNSLVRYCRSRASPETPLY